MTTLRSPFDLSGKVALVTGGSSGLGAAAATALAAAGARIVLLARSADRLAAHSQYLESQGARASWKAIDICDPRATAAAVADVVREAGSLNILVNAAGIICRGPLSCAADADFEAVMKVNSFGTWNMSRAVARVMSRGDAIVNVTSAAGLVGMSDRSIYAASKGAATTLTKALAVELAPQGIRVNAVAPGPFSTDMSRASQATDRWQRLIRDRIPLGRSADVSEIGPPIVFLASAAASFITGVILPVDGGWTAS